MGQKTLTKPFSFSRVDHIWPVLIIAFASALLITGGLYLIGTNAGIPLNRLTGDPTRITRTPISIGILSNLGVMVWAGAASSAFLGAAVLRSDPRRFQFFLASGLFGAVLGLDDLLTIHEYLLPRYLHISEKISYLGYMLLIVVYLLIFLKEILAETDYPLLGIALFFFGLSVVATRFWPSEQQGIFVKDSLKFFGIVFWQVYFFSTTVRLAKNQFLGKSKTLAE